jgi:hypothetical protein
VLLQQRLVSAKQPLMDARTREETYLAEDERRLQDRKAAIQQRGGLEDRK